MHFKFKKLKLAKYYLHLKKLLPFFILFLAAFIFFNQVGYWLTFEAMHQKIKMEVRRHLENKEELETLVISTSWVSDKNIGIKNDFIWVKPTKEFKYNTNMYDISSSYKKGDSTYFLVHHDKDEKWLYQMFAFQFENDENPFQDTTLDFVLQNLIKEALLFSEFRITHYYCDFIPSVPQSKWHFSIKEFVFAPNYRPPIVLFSYVSQTS